MIEICPSVAIPDNEVEITGIRSQGPGGQNVNKVATAVHLRFDINNSSLPQSYKDRLLTLRDRRVSKAGIINIKAQASRSSEKNREAALARFVALIQDANRETKRRKATKPGRAARERRITNKTRRGYLKALRSRVNDRD